MTKQDAERIPVRVLVPRVAQLFVLATFAISATGCSRLQGAEGSTVELTVGSETERFEIRTAFAEYWELSGEADELRITLASYEASCTHFVPPPEGGMVATISVLVPDNVRITTGDYPWAGLPAAGGTPRRPESAYALPFARKGTEGKLLAPGGGLHLTELQLRTHGHVGGLLAFQGTSEDPHAATRLTGPFRARLCRYAPLPSPAAAAP